MSLEQHRHPVLAGDKLALRVVRDAARITGIVAANFVTTLSLPCVVLGGGLPTELGVAGGTGFENQQWSTSGPKSYGVLSSW